MKLKSVAVVQSFFEYYPYRYDFLQLLIVFHETGDVGFDPIGFSNFIPLDFLREAELKHGRICQLAVVGFAATDLGLRLPGAVHDVSW